VTKRLAETIPDTDGVCYDGNLKFYRNVGTFLARTMGVRLDNYKLWKLENFNNTDQKAILKAKDELIKDINDFILELNEPPLE